jgi:uncharacterized metal-binding protein
LECTPLRIGPETKTPTPKVTPTPNSQASSNNSYLAGTVVVSPLDLELDTENKIKAMRRWCAIRLPQKTKSKHFTKRSNHIQIQ